MPGFGRLGLYAWHRTERGACAFLPHPDGSLTVSALEWGAADVREDAPVTIGEVQAGLRRVLGAEIPLAAPTTPGPHLLRRIVGRNTRIAETHRRGRVLLAGDAARAHSAVGAPGLDLGLQDVANLGWKLAAQLQDRAPPGLPDTYEAERRPVAARVTMHSQAQLALMSPGDGITSLRAVFGELLQDDAALRRVAGLLAGADVRYTTGPPNGEHAAAHPFTGCFVPDLLLDAGEGPARLATFLRAARPVLVRPDGYVAWATSEEEPGEQAEEALTRALTHWFGPADDGARVP